MPGKTFNYIFNLFNRYDLSDFYFFLLQLWKTGIFLRGEKWPSTWLLYSEIICSCQEPVVCSHA
jgi:hypothetical protein